MNQTESKYILEMHHISKSFGGVSALQDVSFKCSPGTVHALVGKASFSVEALAENFNALMEELVRMKPTSSKGKYVKAVSLSSTMGAGIRVAFASA